MLNLLSAYYSEFYIAGSVTSGFISLFYITQYRQRHALRRGFVYLALCMLLAAAALASPLPRYRFLAFFASSTLLLISAMSVSGLSAMFRNPELRWAPQRLQGVLLAAFIFFSIAHFIYPSLSLQAISTLCVLGFLSISYLSLSSGLPATGINRQGHTRKYVNSHLSGVNLDKLRKDFEHAMKEYQLYEDPDLSLAKMAETLNVTLHQLSEFLNNHMKNPFRDILASYRVDAAKKLLATRPELSVIGVGFNVGFNSSSAFFRSFKRLTGKTPHQFRKTESDR